MSYQTYMQKTAPTWLQDFYGAAWMGGIGASLDDYVQQYIAGALAAFPDYAPVDALAVIGDELGIDRGPAETDAGYAARLTTAWLQWKYAGAAFGLLYQLWYAGFGSAILVTQNGLAYNLSGAPDITNPAGTLVITNVGSNPKYGSQPWWTFDTNDAFCSRFAVLFYGVPPSSVLTHARATFTGAENGVSTPWPTLTWNNQMPSSSYNILVGVPVITSAPANAVPLIGYDQSTQTQNGVQITSSDSFVGYVDFIAFQSGANPFADLHPNDLARLRSVISKWRPAKATCVGIYVCVQGRFCGWPVRNTVAGAAGVASTVVSFSP